MTIKIKDLNVGDKVLIEVEITDIEVETADTNCPVAIEIYKGLGDNYIEIDMIKKIVRKTFDWKDVKAGMAFKYKEHLVYFIGWHIGIENKGMENCAVCLFDEMEDYGSLYDGIHIEELSRLHSDNDKT